MTLEQYQGVFFLTAGVATFVIMLLALRLVAQRRQGGSIEKAKTKWLAKEQLRIVDIISETHDIKSFIFSRTNGHDFPSFKAGQFLSFQIGDNDKVTRSYSISSVPGSKKIIQISVKLLENGVGSGWLHNLKKGDLVWGYPPSGHFTDHHSQASQLIYLAGGIGITPILSMILTNLENTRPVEMHLFYGMRTQKDMAFHGLLSYLASRHQSFHYHPILSGDPSWPHDTGYLNHSYIMSKLKPAADAEYFICGPKVMADALIDALDAEGVSEDHIFNEEFASPASFDPESIPHRQAEIQIHGKSYRYNGKQTVLEFLEGQGVYVPYSCRAGVCGTCKCKVKGKVHAITTAGLRRDEVKNGLTLACVSFPESDLELDLDVGS